MSLAGWNFLASLAMTGFCLAVFARTRRPPRRIAARRGAV
jgi:hypothetical protein